MYCSNCGDFCTDDMKYCKNCGNKLVKNSYRDIHDFSDLDDNLNEIYNRKKKRKKSSIVPILVISIIFLVMLVLILLTMVIYGFYNKQTNENNLATNQMTPANNEQISDMVDKQLSESVNTKNDEDQTEIENGSEPDSKDAYVAVPKKEWKKAYADYLNKRKADGIQMNYEYGDFIYVNDDNVPELALYGDSEATGCLILTYYKGKIDALYTNRLEFDFIKKGNQLRNTGGHMDYYFDFFYSIQDGKWEEELAGTYGAIYDVQYDKKGSMIYDYEWDGERVSKEEYQRGLKAYYDVSSAQKMEEKSWDDINEILNIEDEDEAKSEEKEKKQRYEIVIADVTWKEAEKLCKDKGGHLVSISSEDEFILITNQIVKEGKETYTFYVGATRDEEYGGNTYHWVYDKTNTLLDEASEHSMWLEGEPSSNGHDADGNPVVEMYVDMFYREDEKRCYFNDVTNNIIGQSPGYKGRIGYICEYE